jgi:DNA polymerase-3 subunit gamma/tau
MTSHVLARKWRPNTFDTMVGQTHAVQALKNALSTNRLHHAYLFTGTRGVGKTSIARILAKALSCEKGVTPNPCGKCQHCRDIEAGRFVDLLEIDAASRSKVEDTREILDNIMYPPTQGQYKIYLIDEVHMLSGHSFNALLKTLEEPPAHVKFLLATTEPKKLPITVLSRCLQFHLKNITQNEMTNHLANILQKEEIFFEPAALSWIAQAANGSVRDALSLLDQAIARGQNQVLESLIRDMLGYVETYYIIELTQAIIEKSGQKILSISADLQHQGAEPSQILRELQKLFHQLTVIQCVPDYQSAAQEGYSIQALTDLAQKVVPQDLQLFYQIALKGFQDLSLAPTPWIALEMTLLRMLAFQPGSSIVSLPPTAQPIQQNNQPHVEESIRLNTRGPKDSNTDSANNLLAENVVTNSIIRPHPLSTEKSKRYLPPQNSGVPENKKFDSSPFSWENILSSLNLSGLANTAAQHCAIKEFNQDKQLILSIPAQYETFLTTSIKQQIEEALKTHFLKNTQKTISVVFDATQTSVSSPAAKQKEKEQVILNNVKTSLEKDSNLNKILEIFHGTIVPDSIKPISN